MSQYCSRTATLSTPSRMIEFVPGRIDSPEDFPRPSVYIDRAIAARSAYLCAKIYPSPDSYGVVRVELSSADPKAFKLYARWLRAGKLDFLNSDDPSLVTASYKTLSWRHCEVLVKAHILGSQFGDDAFQNHVMDELVQWLRPDQGLDRRICELVFGKQASCVSQKLQCLVVDRMFADEMEGNKLLSLFVERKLAGKIGDLALEETCEYHAQESGRCGGERDLSGVSLGEMKSSTGVVEPRNVENGPTAETTDESSSPEPQRRKRKPVPEPWNPSPRCNILPNFDSIRLHKRPTRNHPESDSLPPLPSIHPTILDGFATATADVNEPSSRPPSRRQDSLSLPPPPGIHPSVLEALSANDRLLAEVHQARKPSTSATHKEHPPIHPPRPLQTAPPFNDTASHLHSRDLEPSHVAPSPNNDVHDWPLRNVTPSPTPPSTRPPSLNPTSSPPAPYLESAEAISQQSTPSPSPRRKVLPRHRKSAPPPLSIHPRLALPPISPVRKQRSWPLASNCRTVPIKRKPAPDNGLEFLARYPEGEMLISKAKGTRIDHVREKDAPLQRPFELQGRAVELSELVLSASRPESALM